VSNVGEKSVGKKPTKFILSQKHCLAEMLFKLLGFYAILLYDFSKKYILPKGEYFGVFL
jgi:hypothetical protein